LAPLRRDFRLPGKCRVRPILAVVLIGILPSTHHVGPAVGSPIVIRHRFARHPSPPVIRSVSQTYCVALLPPFALRLIPTYDASAKLLCPDVGRFRRLSTTAPATAGGSTENGGRRPAAHFSKPEGHRAISLTCFLRHDPYEFRLSPVGRCAPTVCQSPDLNHTYSRERRALKGSATRKRVPVQNRAFPMVQNQPRRPHSRFHRCKKFSATRPTRGLGFAKRTSSRDAATWVFDLGPGRSAHPGCPAAAPSTG